MGLFLFFREIFHCVNHNSLVLDSLIIGPVRKKVSKVKISLSHFLEADALFLIVCVDKDVDGI